MSGHCRFDCMVPMENTGLALKLFKFDRSDHIFGKKLTENTDFEHFTVFSKICPKNLSKNITKNMSKN